MQFGSTKDEGGANLINMLMDQFFSEGDANGEAHAHACFSSCRTRTRRTSSSPRSRRSPTCIGPAIRPRHPDVRRGGIATRPTLGIFGEAGPEAVMPLDRLSSIVGGLRDATQTIILKLDGRVLTQTVVRGMPRELALSGVAF
jgi:hypothetical protein